MKRKSTVNRLYTRPVLTKGMKTPNELSFLEPVNPLLKFPLDQGQPGQTPLTNERLNKPLIDSTGFDGEKNHWNVEENADEL